MLLGTVGVPKLTYDLMNSMVEADVEFDAAGSHAVAESFVQFLYLWLLEFAGHPTERTQRKRLRGRIHDAVRRRLRDLGKGAVAITEIAMS